MTTRATVVAAVSVLTLLSYYQFPGHTYLQQDMQIYAPILEHFWDRSVLGKDLIVERPHVAFTLYDEVALGLRRTTGWDFEQVVTMEQVVYRGLGIYGLYLLASSFGLSTGAALLVAAIVSLGATISGPAVLSFEYEPVPRGFAHTLLFLALGMTAQRRYLGAGAAVGVAALYHAPAAVPLLIVYALLAVRPPRRRLHAFLPLAAAALVIWVASRLQIDSAESQVFFARISSELEKLQRLRASYNWVSMWAANWWPHYLLLWAATVLAFIRLWKEMSEELRYLAVGLPLLGLLSMPFSYLALEQAKWALIPQVQPLRALLFLTVMAQVLGVVAAAKAARERRFWEAIPWLILVYLIPTNIRVWAIPPNHRIAVVLALSVLATLALWASAAGRRWSTAALVVAALAGFWAIPVWGKMRNYPALHNGELDQLAAWARQSTAKDAVFLFPDTGRDLDPGIFRARALRAVYVDWKGGGQTNYFESLGREWWRRWQDVMEPPFEPNNLTKYTRAGINYVVRKEGRRIEGRQPVFENARYVVYSTGNP